MRDIFRGYRIFHLDPRKLRSEDFFGNTMEYRRHVMRRFRSAQKSPSEFCCPLCSSLKGDKYLSYRWYEVFECQRCRLVSPNIDFSLLGGAEVYDDPAYIKDTTREILATYAYRKRTYASERLAYILEKTKIPESRLRVLDVGCGPGYFLSYLTDLGIACKGLELAQFLVDICRKKRLNVENADLAQERPKSWNVITLFDVIEHLVDPISFFRQLRKALKPRGYVVAYTPNIHSLAYHLMGGEQNTLYPMQHLCFFDERSLRYLAAKARMRVCAIDYYGLDLMDFLYMQEHKDGYPYLTKLQRAVPYLQAIVDRAKLSNHMRVVFQAI